MLMKLRESCTTGEWQSYGMLEVERPQNSTMVEGGKENGFLPSMVSQLEGKLG